MANFKRKKPRRYVKCVICTKHRFGNKAESHGARYHIRKKEDLREMRDAEKTKY